MKRMSKMERKFRRMLKEFLNCFEDRTRIMRRFPTKPKVPTDI
jgi:hypothetical protein